MGAHRAAALLELLLLGPSLGCSRHDAAKAEPLLVARAASPFVCAGSVCRQAHPRLPDTGEWRCAERGGVVWCAGGEPAAGVVAGPADPSFRCAPRAGTGNAAGERVCIARHPDYPPGWSGAGRCWYAQELGSARVCDSAQLETKTAQAEAALPACWLDRDCASGRCERGACACTLDRQCAAGRCGDGLCQGGAP